MIKELKKKQLKLLLRHFYLSLTIKNINNDLKLAFTVQWEEEVDSLNYTKKVIKGFLYSVSRELRQVKYQIRSEDRNYSNKNK